jgi:D-3-phosphoglycerate dehydrogenase
VKRVEIAYAGKEIDAPEDAKILSVVALKGILEGSLASGTVNFVNANLIAEQIGIDVSETISLDSGDYRNLIRLTVTEGDGQEFAIAGTVLERAYPRIVQIAGHSISFSPEGRLAYVPHSNVPGVIGRVGTIMGEYGVNISKMVTATHTEGRESIMLLGVDEDVPQAAIERCLELGEIHEFKVVNL